MLAPKHTLKVSKLPLRPFLTRVNGFDELPGVTLTPFDNDPSHHFFDQATNMTLLNHKMKQILRAMLLQTARLGWVATNAKNFDMLHHCFVVLRPQYCVAGQWNNYTRDSETIDPDRYQLVINPVIRSVTSQSAAMWEYCASHPNQRLQKVRPVAATVRYLTENCEFKQELVSGFRARVFFRQIETLQGTPLSSSPTTAVQTINNSIQDPTSVERVALEHYRIRLDQLDQTEASAEAKAAEMKQLTNKYRAEEEAALKRVTGHKDMLEEWFGKRTLDANRQKLSDLANPIGF